MSGKLTRRSFLNKIINIAAISVASGFSSISSGCKKAALFGLVLKGGNVYDGSGAKPYKADIGIDKGTIKYIGRIDYHQAQKIIDVSNFSVAPGFIDIHTHTAEHLLVNPLAESSVRQGVTTVVGGNCGESLFPLNDEMFEETEKVLRDEYGLLVTWKDAAGFLSALKQNRTAVNFATFTGHGTLRANVAGYSNRKVSQQELETMRRLLVESMAQGAIGLSSGLEYTPGSFAPAEEIIYLAKAVASRNGVYASHLRDEEDEIIEAFDEAVDVARKSGVKVQVSHLKIGLPKNWPKFPELISRFNRAAEEGLTIQADRYPYIAWATGLSQFFPVWAREGKKEDFIARLRAEELQLKLKQEVIKKGEELGGWDKVFISFVSSEENRVFEGQTVETGARLTNLEPYEFIKRLLIDEQGRAGMIVFGMSEDHLKQILTHPLVSIGSDGASIAPYGPLSKGKPHPRNYGTFARVLGRYVRDEKVVSLEEMIRKMTSMPAEHIGLHKRGLIKTGWAADLVVFNPDEIEDLATWTEPARYPQGIAHVLVNGVLVVEEGQHTKALSGKILKKQQDGLVR